MVKMPNLEDIKKLVRSVLMSSKEGVSAACFSSDYRSLTKKELRPDKYGFRSAEDLLKAMPDVARMSYSRGDVVFYAVNTEDTVHIQRLVSNQKDKKRKASKKSTYKCSKPYHRITGNSPKFFNPLLSSHKMPLRNLRQVKSTGISTERMPGQRMRAAAKKPSYQYKESTVKLDKASPKQSLSAVAISPVIINRIKSVLTPNSHGIRIRDFEELYKRSHGVSLRATDLNALKSGTVKDIARIEELVLPGKNKDLILYPAYMEHQQAESKVHKMNEKLFSIDPSTGEMLMSDILKIRLLNLLRESNGLSFYELKNQYEKRFKCKISDSILHGLECGQIKNVAKVEKCRAGNREFVTFYPIGSDNAAVQSTGLSRTCHAKKTSVKGSEPVLRTDVTNFIKPQNVAEINAVCKLDEQSRGTGSTNENQGKSSSRFPKYPAVPPPSMAKRTFPIDSQVSGIQTNSLHYGIITHTGNGVRFTVQISVESEYMKKLQSISKEQRRLADQNVGSYVVVDGRRAEVLSVSQGYATVYFLDYGNTCQKCVTELYDMPCQALEIPRLAVICEFDRINGDDDQQCDTCQELLQEYVNYNVILDVVSMKSETINGQSLAVPVVQCYVRSEQKNLNLEILKNRPCKPGTTSPKPGFAKDEHLPVSPATAMCHHLEKVIQPRRNIEKDICSAIDAPLNYSMEDQEAPLVLMENVPIQSNEKNNVVISLPSIPSFKGEFGKLMKVVVTKVISPNHFFMIPVERLVHLKYVTNMMAKHFSKKDMDSLQCKPSVKDRRMYAAACKTDAQSVWTRVEVKHVLKDRVCVQLVDLGRTAYINMDSLYPLPRNIAVIPKLAIAGRLGGVVLKNSFNSEALQRFKQLTFGRQLTAHVVGCVLEDDSLVFDVSLFHAGDEDCKSINDVMVEKWKVSEYISVS